MPLPREFRRLLILVATIGLVGCSGASESRPTGKVVLHGAPVVRANIRFETGREGYGPFAGVTDEAGRYELDYGARPGIPLGPARVTVTRALLLDGSPLPSDEEGAYLLETGKATLETSVYEVDLKRGGQRLDFDLIEGDRSQK